MWRLALAENEKRTRKTMKAPSAAPATETSTRSRSVRRRNQVCASLQSCLSCCSIAVTSPGLLGGALHLDLQAEEDLAAVLGLLQLPLLDVVEAAEALERVGQQVHVLGALRLPAQ